MSKKIQNQSPHWVDQVTTNILEWQKKNSVKKLHVDDMKTPSGRVHTGALRGVMIHDIVAKSLIASGKKETVSTYVFNDMDPMDGLPAYLDPKEYEQHMGKPLFQIPAPSLEKSGIDFSNVPDSEQEKYRNAKSFGEFYALDFIEAFRRLGCSQELVWSHELYLSGQMDETIRHVLDHVNDFRAIYKDVADYDLPSNWFPFQVICPQCGKVGTTLVNAWDGKQVSFECQPNKVEWAKGCGFSGKISPFGGTGKLLWKTDWPSHWQVMGVTIEGAGKDHTSAGGSRDMADAIVKKVFDNIPPFNIPYEWILIRGAKMSSSKGVGTSAREFVELFPPDVGRFLFVHHHFGQVIDFDPQTMAIPDLFDLYDQAARIYWKQEDGDQRLARSYELAQIGKTPESHFLPRFRDVALWMQYPEIDEVQKSEELKNDKLTSVEKTVLQERIKYAKIWVNRYAPEEYQWGVTKTLPDVAQKLSDEQVQYLSEVEQLLSEKSWQPQELQQALFDVAKASLGAKAGFQAIYLTFLGKTAGPRAAWLLLSLDKSALSKRFQAVKSMKVKTVQNEKQGSQFDRPDLFSFTPEFSKSYPTATVGFAILKGVKIAGSNPSLEKEKTQVLSELKGLTVEQIGTLPEILSYRKMYKQMGIDWHSRRPSPEALLRRFAQGKDLYTVNTCVDAYNLVVMKHRVSVGAFDLSQVHFPTRLDIAQGGEEILLLGGQEPTKLKPGEVSYFDQTGPYNLDYNYRDAQRTQVQLSTTDLLINVDGIFDISPQQVGDVLDETIAIIQKYCGGKVEVKGIIQG